MRNKGFRFGGINVGKPFMINRLSSLAPYFTRPA